MVGVAALTVVALVFVALAVHRSSSLTKGAATTPPSFPPAVSASSAPLAAASAASTAPGPPVVVFFGDTYTAGDGASIPAMRWTSLVAADFGWTEKNYSFGGTGYSTGGPSTRGTPYTARIAGIAVAAPSIVIVAGGRADVDRGSSPAQIKAAVTATFTALRTALPNAAIVAESPLWASNTPPAALAVVAADVKAAVTAVGGRYLDVGQPLVAAPTDVMPNARPNDAGYAALAAAFETAYRS
jgi:hypothetical protein